MYNVPFCSIDIFKNLFLEQYTLIVSRIIVTSSFHVSFINARVVNKTNNLNF